MYNFFDAPIKLFFPTWALERAKKRTACMAYDSAYESSSFVSEGLRDWFATLDSPNRELDNMSFETQKARSRDANRNILLARAIIDRLQTNVVNTGLKVQSAIDYEMAGITEAEAKKLSSEISKKFDAWASDASRCNVQAECNFYRAQKLIVSSAGTDGDVFINFPVIKDQLTFELIDSDRIQSPDKSDTTNIKQGIEYNKLGRATHYHVLTDHPSKLGSYELNRYPIYDTNGLRRIYQIKLLQYRTREVRGESVLSIILKVSKKLDKYSQAELAAAIVSGNFTVFLKSLNPRQALGKLRDSNKGRLGQNTHDTRMGKNELKLGNGAIMALPPNMEIQNSNPARPNSNYTPFVNEHYSEAGGGVGIPGEIIKLLFTKSYSASRAAKIEGDLTYDMRRQPIKEDAITPAFKLWLTHEVFKKRIKLPGFFDDEFKRDGYLKHTILPITSKGLDEVKDRNASKIGLQSIITNRKIECEKLGYDFEEIAKQYAAEIKLLTDLGIKPDIEIDEMLTTIESEDTDEVEK